MVNPLGQYVRWLHTRWPAGMVEKMPEVGEDGATNVPGLRIVGDLTGIPLLKFSAHTGARAVRAFAAEKSFAPSKDSSDEVLDVAIIGAGVSGIAAALEARVAGLHFRVFEAYQPFNTIANFPKGKPIFTYPTDMVPDGQVQFSEKSSVKEGLLAELEAQREAAGIELTPARIVEVKRRGGLFELLHGDRDGTITRARRVVVGIGRSGNYRKLGVPGQQLDKVYHRLYDPKDYAGKRALVVGGGDSALETAIALATCGAHVTLAYRKPEFSRPKPENADRIRELQRDIDADIDIETPVSDRMTTASFEAMRDATPQGSIAVMMSTSPKCIEAHSVTLVDATHEEVRVANDVVFAMIGREAPLDFFRRSGVHITGEWRPMTWVAFVAFVAFCTFVYNWKLGGALTRVFETNGWFPFNVSLEGDPGSLWATLAISLKKPGFYYTFAYSAAIVLFGFDRIRRRKTPYVNRQTAALMGVQVLPLFLLPYVLLPWMGANGWFDGGWLGYAADELMPKVNYDHGREYWRAFGFVLAWPLFVWNFFTEQPNTWWLVIGCIQTFVIIPLMVWRWGKGAYCGWICSCGALAETLGDRHRHKMPHGPKWNRLNLVGQVILFIAFAMFAARIASWVWPNTSFGTAMASFHDALLRDGFAGISLTYKHVVDLTLAGIVGVGLYFWFSGRVWCRFACPLAALMHIYARFSRFRIFPDKKKCISCNLCTSVCHQGIDIMNFANKGIPMEDPECVRCSACVQTCPTGTLTFGRLGTTGEWIQDRVPASIVQMAESKRRRVAG